jgi:cardiolipin synthase C
MQVDLVRVVLAVCLVGLLGACAMSPQRIAEVDALVDQQRGGFDLPPAAKTVDVSSLARLTGRADRHHLLVVEHGNDALALRLHLIRAARDRIVLQNYIFHDDASGSLLLNELLLAARRGVRVRVLVDSLFSLPDARLQATLELADDNFELRLYKPLFDRAVAGNAAFLGAVVCCFRSLNQRMHNKLLVIDGQHGLIGGRNSADRYFELDTRMNFVDMEVLVSGPVVVEMEAGFERFWDHHRTVPPRHTHDVMQELFAAAPVDLPLPVPDRLDFAFDMIGDRQWFERLVADKGFWVERVEYFTDPPEKHEKLHKDRSFDSTSALHGLIASADQRVLMQTPYFVMSPRFESVLADLSPHVEVTVSSNSLAATDAYPVYALSRRQRSRMVAALGIRLFEAKPFPAARYQLLRRYPELIAERAAGIHSPMRGDPAPATVDMPGPRISLHAKIVVIDDRIASVSSHNFDPRSELFNTENGIIVHDRDFSRAMTEYVALMTEPGNAWLVAPREHRTRVMAAINQTMGRVSRRMPTLDFWPAYLTENYQLPSGAEPVPPEHPDFHDTWVPVGLSPDVTFGQRRVLTAIISRMFGFAWPVM